MRFSLTAFTTLLVLTGAIAAPAPDGLEARVPKCPTGKVRCCEGGGCVTIRQCSLMLCPPPGEVDPDAHGKCPPGLAQCCGTGKCGDPFRCALMLCVPLRDPLGGNLDHLPPGEKGPDPQKREDDQPAPVPRGVDLDKNGRCPSHLKRCCPSGQCFPPEVCNVMFCQPEIAPLPKPTSQGLSCCCDGSCPGNRLCMLAALVCPRV